MVEFKLTINDPKTGRSYSKTVDTAVFKGKKIGDVVEGETLGLKGYALEITGGSDSSGFPMRRDLEGIAKKRALLTSGSGVRGLKLKQGVRLRKTIRGSSISLSTTQVNLKVKGYGPKGLDEMFGIKKEEVKEEVNAENGI